MAFFSRLFRLTTSIASFAQVLLYLPLALDIAGKECMLALSLLLSITFSITATSYLITRNTRLRPLSTFLALFQPLAIPALLLLALNLYSSDRLLARSELSTFWYILKQAPGWWETILRTSSPVFTILEGLSTLLCIQAISRFSKARIERSRMPDVLSLVFLIGAAGVYVGSAYFLWESYDSGVPDRLSATLIGVTITSILFLSGISFAAQRGNVVETSLVLAYAVFQIFHLSSRPEMYSAGLWQQILRAPGTNGHPPLPPVVLQSLDAISSLVSHTFGAGVEFVSAASSALPLPVLVGLFYRVAVMYAASRIILALKRQNEGYEDTRKLSEEEPAARVMTVIVTYARLILIAVYTHLLLLSSSGHQSFWRWLNIFLTVGLWGVELSLAGGAEEAQWKAE